MTTTALSLPLRAAGLRLEKLRQSWLYDALMRLPILGWATLIVLESAVRLQNYVETADPTLPACLPY